MAENNSPHVAWPSVMRGARTQAIIEEFFRAADDPTRHGSVSFSNCFLPTGELVARGHTCKGRDELIAFRQGAWDPISTRKHELVKVYLSDSNERDIAVLGKVTFGHKSGSSTTQEFAGNFIMGDDEDGALIREYRAWLDSKPLADLIANAQSV